MPMVLYGPLPYELSNGCTNWITLLRWKGTGLSLCMFWKVTCQKLAAHLNQFQHEGTSTTASTIQCLICEYCSNIFNFYFSNFKKFNSCFKSLNWRNPNYHWYK